MSAAARGAVFVGRERELGVLAGHLAAQDRSSSGVLLSGPAGVGKTTLVDQAVRDAAALPVVRGYCPAEPAPPLWPWRAALRRAAHGGVTRPQHPGQDPVREPHRVRGQVDSVMTLAGHDSFLVSRVVGGGHAAPGQTRPPHPGPAPRPGGVNDEHS